MRFFLAGIMQGSHLGAVVHNQDYRQRIKELLSRHFPEAEIYDPWADHSNSLNYDDEQARRVFFFHNRLCREVDVVVAVAPEASMGTAIEMWEAHRHGRLVIAISPLAHNWSVKYLSTLIYPDLEQFAEALDQGQVARAIRQSLLATAAAHESEPPALEQWD